MLHELGKEDILQMASSEVKVLQILKILYFGDNLVEFFLKLKNLQNPQNLDLILQPCSKFVPKYTTLKSLSDSHQ